MEQKEREDVTMKYEKSMRYSTPFLQKLIMGPNPVKLAEELLEGHDIPCGATVCDLGSGQGLTSLFLAREYGFTVYAADLWSDPQENKKFFDAMGADEKRLIPVKADAFSLPFEKEFFDAVISVDSYNYFGRDPKYLDENLLPFVKPGGYVYAAVPGMKKDCHHSPASELLLSWTPEQLEYIHDIDYWKQILGPCMGAELVSIKEMESNEEVWADWLMQDNEYARNDRKAMDAGGGRFLNFISFILKKKA